MEKVLNFKGVWRSYQQRILDNLDYHLSDKKLHIVAAPGAGKTTLGIEVISRLNAPTLILVPTNTIKNQWRDRICSSFSDKKDWNLVSTDIKHPKFVTIITYQALLAAFCASSESENSEIEIEEEDFCSLEANLDTTDSISRLKRFQPDKAQEIIKILKEAKLSVLCFDEAHHLRNEWWKAIIYLNDELKPAQTLSLTATPPYDVDIAEWERYKDLCGDIDEVISIPELVKNGDLCPHQDFVYFSNLNHCETELIKKQNQNVKLFIDKLNSDTDLISYISTHDIIKNPQKYEEIIYENPEFYVSVVSFLNNCGIRPANQFLKLFDSKQRELPKFDIVQANIFINGLLSLYRDTFIQLGEKIEEYKNYASKLELFYNKKFYLINSIKIQKQIASSLGKLDSITDIVSAELNCLKQDLRMVILADFIRAEDTENNHVGVIPIWRILKNNYKKDALIAVLCGSLIYIPKIKAENLYKLLEFYNISPENISISEVKEDSDYLYIIPKDSCRQKIVSLITEMFCKGDINILIGTQALLGEGWDAPCINSFVLSSTVSSYMLSNQMRGRAIRIDKSNPKKVANIWHLATVVTFPKSDILLQNFDNSLWYDIEQLKKRFEGFEAPSYNDSHEIVNGLERVIDLNKFKFNISQRGDRALFESNKFMIEQASNRDQTFNYWNKGIDLGYKSHNLSVKTGIESDKSVIKTLKYTSYKEIADSIFWFFAGLAIAIPHKNYFGVSILEILFVAFIFAMLFVLIKYIKTGTISGIMKQIAIVHLKSLTFHGLIKTPLNRAGLNVENKDAVYVSCKNLQTDENNIFIKTLQEFLNPIENPRYLLVKQNNILGFVKQEDYFAIPAVLSSNKKDVNLFKKLWEKHIGKCKIVYTRNSEGRKLLLKARENAFSASKRPKSKRLSKWQ